MRFVLIVLWLVFITGCSSMNPTSEVSNKPKASGESGEIIFVMDSIHWKSELGSALNETFRSKTPGLPRPESLFTIRPIQPLDFKSILKNAKNIVIVYVMDNESNNSNRIKNFFTPNSLIEIANDTTKFLLSKKNEWARGQEVMFLYGKSEQTLSRLIETNKDKLQKHFNQIEKSRLNKSLYVSKELKEVGSLLSRNHGFSLRIPYGWRIDYESPEDNFIWLRNPGLAVDKNLWICYTDYNGPEDFDNVVALRNNVTRRYIFDNKEVNDTSYVVVEKLVPPIVREINFHGQYAKEIKGLWKTNNLSMGGPFISYVFADAANGRLYIIDGFVYSPGKPQREFIRELETILWTFSTSMKDNSSI